MLSPRTRRILGTLLVLLIAAPGLAYADVAFKGGVNFATVKTDPSSSDLATYTGFVGGLAIDSGNNTVGFQLETLFSMKGVKEKGGSGFDHLTYFEVPVLLRVKVAEASKTLFTVHVGPSVAYRLRAREGDASGDTDIADFVKVYDVGLAFGAEIDVSNFVVDGRYTLGLVDINKDNGLGNVTVKNRAFTIMAGVRF